MDPALSFAGLEQYRLSRGEVEDLGRRCLEVVVGSRWLHETHADDYFVAEWGTDAGRIQLRDAATSMSAESCVLLPAVDENTPETVKKFVEDTTCQLPDRTTCTFASHSIRENRQRKGFTPKKTHEVEQFREVLRLLASQGAADDVSVILNIGEGRGHLSEAIVPAISGKVRHLVGLDCEEALCASSMKRAEKEKKSDEVAGVSRHAVHCRVQNDMTPSDYSTLVNKATDLNIPTDLNGVGLIGLHACGDLSSTTIRLFAKSASPLLVLAPCCYHALTSEGFPLSKEFAEKGYFPTMVSRMLACAPVGRWTKASPEEHLQKYRLGFYRAVVQKAVWPERLEVAPSAYRKFAKSEDLTLSAFMDVVLGKEKGEREGMDIKTVRAAALQLDTSVRFKEYLAFVTLRRCVAEALELLLVIDRWLFLYETSKASVVLPLFNPAVSPRCYVFVAVKGSG